MRKLFTLLTLCLLASAAWAGDVVFVAGTDNGTSTGERGAYTIEKEGVKIDVSDGLANSSQYRMYKSSTTTITSTAGAITKVVFECTAEGDAQYGPGCFTVNVGDYQYSGKVGTWSGASENIVFTASTNQVRATKITVTTSASGLAAPEFSPKAGTYYEPFQVKITCASQGAKIYYTTDGNDPTTASTQYSAPIQVNGDMTIKAISALDGKTSDVATAKYVIATPVTVNNIAGYQALADGTAAKFANSVNVLYQYKGYLYVKDNSGYALFYGDCGQTYVNGDKIPAGFCGTKTTYAGEPELQWLASFKATAGNTPIMPTEIGADQVSHETFAQFVEMKGVTITKSEDGKSYTITDKNGKTCAVYFGTLGVSAPENLSIKYDVKGIVGSYGKENTVYQLLPTELTPVIEGDLSLRDLYDTPDDTQVMLTYDAIVLGQNGQYLYLMDEKKGKRGFGLVFGQPGKTYKHGDVISKGYGGTKVTYDGYPEIKNPTGFGDPIGFNVPEPEPIATLNEISEDWGRYVSIKVKVTKSGYILTDEAGNTCTYYDRFLCAFPPEGEFAEVHAIVGTYQGNFQLLPVKFIIDIHPIDVASIDEMFNLDMDEDYGRFTTPLTAIYQSGSYLYVKDVQNKETLVYGKLTNSYQNGDVINGAVTSWTLYPKTNGYAQLVPLDEYFLPATEHVAPVEPIEDDFENIMQSDVHKYYVFYNVNINATETARKYTMTDEYGDEMTMYNQFNIELPEITPEQTYDVYGFFSIHSSGERAIFPCKVVKHGEPEPLEGDVNGDGSVNIADVNVLINIILGATLDAETMKRADVNKDGSINVSDINRVIAIILK